LNWCAISIRLGRRREGYTGLPIEIRMGRVGYIIDAYHHNRALASGILPGWRAFKFEWAVVGILVPRPKKDGTDKKSSDRLG
jgi:hypothetical protein